MNDLLHELDARMTPEPNSGCWLWTGVYGAGGYGVFRKKKAHRAMYELTFGEVPEGLVLDHLCRVRECVNPDHLEAVTHSVNILRGTGASARNAAKTHCKNGHAFEGENLIVNPSGHRLCRVCEMKRRQNTEERRSSKRRAARLAKVNGGRE